jgi:hypothetical protein
MVVLPAPERPVIQSVTPFWPSTLKRFVELMRHESSFASAEHSIMLRIGRASIAARCLDATSASGRAGAPSCATRSTRRYTIRCREPPHSERARVRCGRAARGDVRSSALTCGVGHLTSQLGQVGAGGQFGPSGQAGQPGKSGHLGHVGQRCAIREASTAREQARPRMHVGRRQRTATACSMALEMRAVVSGGVYAGHAGQRAAAALATTVRSGHG